MIETEHYWKFPNGNEYSKDTYSKEQALELINTLVDCVDCTDCYNCIGCINCHDCIGCDYCTNCEKCTDCANSSGLWGRTGIIKQVGNYLFTNMAAQISILIDKMKSVTND